MLASVLKLTRADCSALNLKDEYSVHRVVYSLFPKQDDKTRDFLYADKGGDWNSRQILLLSSRAPKQPAHGELVSKEIPDSFLNWSDYAFEVTVNPVERNGKAKTATPIRGTEKLLAWFKAKAPGWGFSVDEPSLQVTKIGVLQFDRQKDGSSFTQTHGTATFIGKLTVSDRQTFIKSFKQGIGRAKGFGFGLFQIVPIQNFKKTQES